MSAHTDRRTETTPLRLTYAGYADHATGQFGGPALARPVPLAEGVLGFFRRSGPPDLVSFHIEHFSASFERLDQAWLATALGDETVGALAELWRQIPPELPRLSGLPEKELAEAMRASIVRVETEIPSPSARQQKHWADLLRAWEDGAGEAEPAAYSPARLRIQPRLVKKSRQLAESLRGRAAGASEVVFTGIRWGEEAAPALVAARRRSGELHDRFVWEETGDDPVHIELREEGNLLWATGFAKDEYRGEPVSVRLWLKPQALRALHMEAEVDPQTRQVSVGGLIASDGWFRLLVGQRKPRHRLPMELVDALEVAVG